MQTQIQMRLDRILGTGHFGTYNFFDEIIELKWKSGLRIYTARIGKNKIAILNGGTKNGQQKDIKKAKKILKTIKEDQSPFT
jgi:putative addiction module killer protein